MTSGEFWSTAHQPTLKRAEALRGDLLRRRASSFAAATTTSTRIPRSSVSPEDDIELRRVRITNRARDARGRIEVTSYAEVVLAPAASDALHPAFSNLFVQTEIVRERQAILCTRRPRSRRATRRRGCST